MTSVNVSRYVLGTICLALAILFIALSGPAAAGYIFNPTEVPPGLILMLFGIGCFFGILAVYLWIRAVKLTPGDHILSDQRGLLVALMLVTTLFLGTGMLWILADPEFWRGVISGMIDGSSQ
jgi:drug/metabolite transporter (DMT)-like permease